VIQVAWRVLAWFVAFNLLYLIVQPLDHPITLYNSVFPGRLRFEWQDQRTLQVSVPELKLSRLLADHILSRRKQPDEYRILMLGSSELWGVLRRDEETAPVVFDRMGIQTGEGRRVRSYNLGYISPSAFKDLMILHYILMYRSDEPDAVILFINSNSLGIVSEPNPLYADNADLGLEVMHRYEIQEIEYQSLLNSASMLPGWIRHSFIGERDNISYWLMNQFFGFGWLATGSDQVFPPDGEVIPFQGGRGADLVRWTIDQQKGTLEGFSTLSKEHHFFMGIVVVPMNFDAPGFVDALAGRTQALGIPLLDCSMLLPFGEFTDSPLHMSATGHQLLAGEVAHWLETRWADPHAPLWSECRKYNAP
jgi:hypothetical protein